MAIHSKNLETLEAVIATALNIVKNRTFWDTFRFAVVLGVGMGLLRTTRRTGRRGLFGFGAYPWLRTGLRSLAPSPELWLACVSRPRSRPPGARSHKLRSRRADTSVPRRQGPTCPACQSRRGNMR
jgi:hypothetical protein